MKDSNKRAATAREGIFTEARCLQLLMFAAVTVFALFSRFRTAHPSWYFEDDFYYYAQVAKNLALHGRSTFDGVHSTNGYHPLWQWLLTATYVIFGGRFFLVGVQLLTLVGCVFLFIGALRCFRIHGVRLEEARWSACIVALLGLLVMRGGMETALALPLIVWSISFATEEIATPRTSVTISFGLLACMAVLARLDSSLLFGLLISVDFLTRKKARKPWRIVILLACFLPFFAYLMGNWMHFHTLLPVSAEAKELKPRLPLSFSAWRGSFLPLTRLKTFLVLPATMLIPVFFLRSSEGRRLIPLVLLGFVFVQLSALSISSDWTVWSWYLYPFVLLGFAELMILGTTIHSRTYKQLLLFICGVYATYFILYASWNLPSPKAETAQEAAEFAAAHPAMYAMGDNAGEFAYLSGQPVVQLEGLMMDHAYLSHIRRQEPLREVLKTYNVTYFVSLVDPNARGCITLREPAQAGQFSPHVNGVVCSKPVALFTQDGSSIGIYRADDIR